MGQTLDHGVYLPAEGERNCYSGLASNWQILNTAVGNIAEKAPLVHTHGNISNDGKIGSTANLPLITGTGGAVQAGSFGNQANTFCEGNDSRLSDARTPVAHTHTKSNITDLLNSNFIPSANNSYDLGSSSYQWNNVYAKKVNTQSVNGVNPGALSLPSGAAENINTDNWNFSWSANTVTAPFDGYISIACFGSALQINNETKSYAMTYAPGSDGFICGLLPVSSGDSIKVLVTRTQTSIYEGYKFIKASGNVS